MKYEMLMLRGLFAACLLVSGLILGTMIVAPTAALQLAAAGTNGTALSATTTACALPDGVICPQSHS
jgi:hypothetical protein